MSLESKFNISISDEELDNIKTIMGLVDLIDNKCGLVACVESKPKSDKLEAFLYLLMRDHVPVGVVPKIIEEIPDCNLIFSNSDLHNIAKNYSKILKE
jgi:hypothetical protein